MFVRNLRREYLIVGNTLNSGYLFANRFNALGYSTRYIYFTNDSLQDFPNWFGIPDNSYGILLPKRPVWYRLYHPQALYSLARIYWEVARSKRIILMQDSPSFVPGMRRLKILISIGADLQVYPLNPKVLFEEKFKSTPFHNALLSLFSFITRKLQQKGLRDMDLIFCQPYQNDLARLFSPSAIVYNLPFPLFDLTQSEVIEKREYPALTNFLQKIDFVVFSPARINFGKAVGNYGKGNNILLAGFHQFLSELSDEQRKKVGLVLVEKGRTDEIAELKTFSLSLGLDCKNVLWLPEMRQSEIVNILRNTNLIVCDQFLIPSFGNIAREAILQGKILVTRISDDYYDMLGSSCPGVFDARDERSIRNALLEIFFMRKEERVRLGSLNTNWALKNLNSLGICREILQVIQKTNKVVSI